MQKMEIKQGLLAIIINEIIIQIAIIIANSID